MMQEREAKERELNGVRIAEQNLKSEVIYLKSQIEYLKDKLETCQKKLEQTERLAVCRG
jgi:peptidoglycan hydrolase CwlO-like protein